MNITQPPTPLEAPKRPMVRPSGIVVPRADIVISRRRPIVPRAQVALASPGLRPAATTVRLEATQATLRTLTVAREEFVERVAAARAQARTATDDGTRVAAMRETYRAEAALDDLLRRTLRDVTALMEERGLR